MGHEGYKSFFNGTDANLLADRVIGWHGLCLSILNALQQLRVDLFKEMLIMTRRQQQEAAEAEAAAAAAGEGSTSTSIAAAASLAASTSTMASSFRIRTDKNGKLILPGNAYGSDNDKTMEVINNLAVGGFTTSRHAMTGVGVPATMGSAYS